MRKNLISVFIHVLMFRSTLCERLLAVQHSLKINKTAEVTRLFLLSKFDYNIIHYTLINSLFDSIIKEHGMENNKKNKIFRWSSRSISIKLNERQAAKEEKFKLMSYVVSFRYTQRTYIFKQLQRLFEYLCIKVYIFLIYIDIVYWLQQHQLHS